MRLGRFKRTYGASPVHLIAHLAGAAIAAYALVQLLDEKRWVNFLVWFIGAALLHDLVLLPAYSALDRLARLRAPSRLGRGRDPGGRDRAGPRDPARPPDPARPRDPGRGRDPARHRVPIVNHIRAPALISGVLLLIYFPLILGPAGPQYASAAGHHPTGYLRNWLLITAALFGGSAALYAIRAWRR